MAVGRAGRPVHRRPRVLGAGRNDCGYHRDWPSGGGHERAGVLIAGFPIACCVYLTKDRRLCIEAQPRGTTNYEMSFKSQASAERIVAIEIAVRGSTRFRYRGSARRLSR